MSEFVDLHWEPENIDDEPAMRLDAADDFELLATRMNTRLHTFLGRGAFNHIFISNEIAEDGREMGYFVWAHNTGFEDMEEFMMEHDYPAVLNALVVPASDIEVYYKTITKDDVEDETDFIPSEWETE
jgi:hypothetical protein